MQRILIFEISKRIQISQKCSFTGKEYQPGRQQDCKIKWRSCPNEAMSGRKSLRCGSKEGGDGSQSVTPPHYQPPPLTLTPQKPSFVKLQKSTRQHHSCTDSIAYFVVIYFYFASRQSFMHNLHIRLTPLFSLGRFHRTNLSR